MAVMGMLMGMLMGKHAGPASILDIIQNNKNLWHLMLRHCRW